MTLTLLLSLAQAMAPGPSSGPPTLHLSRTPAVQWRLTASPRYQAFADAWGATYVRWDERTGVPRFLGMTGAAESDAEALVAAIAQLANLDAAELTLATTRSRPFGDTDRTTSRYTRTWRGAPVEGDEVVIVATGGRIGAVWVRLTPISGLPTPRSNEVIVADPARGFGRLVHVYRSPMQVRAVDRAGAVVFDYDPRRFDTVTVTHEETTVGDALVTDAARGVTVTDETSVMEVTADDGSHSLTGNLMVELTGPDLVVLQNGASITHTGTDDIDLDPGDDITYSAANTLHHFHQVWDWLGDRWPTHGWLGRQVQANVDMSSGSCNAYYTSGTVNFFASSGVCNATGRIASVVYHEIGHGIHEYILAGGTFASDVSEGSADFVSATILDDPTISAGFYVDGSAIRELETDRVYPTDVTGEVHNDGLIWASFLWDLREAWTTTYAYDAGVELTDALFLGALEQGPELTDLLEAVLVADDDDGDWSNGTPHDCELIDLLTLHGLGPGAMGVLEVGHVPLGAQASDTEGYPVEVDVLSAFSTCTGIGAPSVSVWHTADAHALPPNADGSGWEPWSELPLSTADGVSYTGTIPRLPATSTTRYFYEITAADGSTSESSHSGNEQDLFQFWIGDRAPLWCEDFEAGEAGFVHADGIPWESLTGAVDDWSFGSPLGTGTFDPDLAWSGAQIATTALDANYQPQAAEYLQTPTVDLSTPGRMRLLTYQRWLTVEDGLYDHARVVVNDGTTWTPIWSNAATAAGSHQLLDGDWSTRDHDLAAFLTPDGSTGTPLSFDFSLQTDAGLEFGGWALDDLCVIELDDVPDHYRRVGLVASWADAGEEEVGTVDVSWHTPWIKPLSLTVLVRQEGRAPESLTDGVILDLDLSPVWGEVKTVVDTLPGLERGTEWHYALFAAGEDDLELYETAVEGQNAATVGFPIRDTGEPIDTADSGDSGVPEDSAVVVDSGGGKSEDTGAKTPGGCGCASGAGAPLGGLALVMAALATARRRRGSERSS
ncbi:hypothetical protein LBMAG42_43530 [Deltaproteobacteria bacterium]|nr:hypothetical protein LBMAG42_43530 [Deltaproteobacteria bacterium]